MKTPKDFGAYNSPDINNDIALQKWFDSSEPILLLDTFYSSTSTLVYPSHKIIQGVGTNMCGILAHPQMPTTSELFLNKAFSPDLILSGYTTFKDLTIGGRALVPREAKNGCFSIIGFERLCLERVLFRDWELDAIAAQNLKNCTFRDLEFIRCGSNIPFLSPGTGTYVGGSIMFLFGKHVDTYISGVRAHDLYGSGGIWLGGGDSRNTILVDFFLEGLSEFGVAGAPPGSIISRGRIDGVKRIDVSGHCMEMGGSNYVVSNMNLSNADGTCFYGSNLKNVLLTDSVMSNPNRLDKKDSCIVIASHPESMGVGNPPCEQVNIQNLTLRDETKKAAHAILFYNNLFGAEQQRGKMNNILCQGINPGEAGMWQEEMIKADEEVRGNNFVVSI